MQGSFAWNDSKRESRERLGSYIWVEVKRLMGDRQLSCRRISHWRRLECVIGFPFSSRLLPALHQPFQNERWSWNAICVCRVKLRLPYSPVAAEIANSSANQWKRGLRGSSLIKITRTLPPPGIVATTFRVLKRYAIPVLCVAAWHGDRRSATTRHLSHSGSFAAL